MNAFQSIENVTRIKSDYEPETTYKIVAQSSIQPVAKDGEKLYFYVSPGYLEILINERVCCCAKDLKYRIKGTSKKAHNRINAVEAELQRQVDDIINKYHLEIAKEIKKCIDS